MGEDGILRTEDFRYRYDTVEGWEVGVTSYRLGDQFFCSVDNVSPGARLARARGRKIDSCLLCRAGLSDSLRRFSIVPA